MGVMILKVFSKLNSSMILNNFLFCLGFEMNRFILSLATVLFYAQLKPAPLLKKKVLFFLNSFSHLPAQAFMWPLHELQQGANEYSCFLSQTSFYSDLVHHAATWPFAVPGEELAQGENTHKKHEEDLDCIL